MTAKIAIGLAAAFGGIFPNVFRLATSMTQGEPMPEGSYILGVILFGVIGAGTALALDEDEKKKAFFLGLGLPAMFQSAASDVTTAAVRLELFPPAYAAEEPDRRVEILWEGRTAPTDFSIIYRTSDDKRRVKDDFAQPSELTESGAPLWVSGAQIVVGDVRTGARSEWVDFPPGDEPLRFVCRVNPKIGSGFKKAIGLNADEYTVELELQEETDGKRKD